MALKQYNPTSPGRRFMTTLTFEEITKDHPEKSLTEPKKRTGGRNGMGRTTIWFRGGGHKQRYRIVDFRRDKKNVPAKVAAIEYDPNRSARLALLHYADGEKRYILGPEGMTVGQTVVAGDARRHPARQLPAPEADPRGHHGPQHRAAPRQGRADGAQRGRAPPSSWPRKASTPRSSCPRARCARSTWTAWPPSARWATSTTRTSPSARRGASAGWAGVRTTAGSSMNPVDHPHGGGEGKTSGRPASRDSLGQAHQGRQDPQQQAHAVVHRQEAEVSHGTIAQEGPFRGRPPA